MAKPGDPICTRLPDDLDAALRMKAESEGKNTAEILRNLVAQYVYGSIPSTDEGYTQARMIATRLAHEALTRCLQTLPQTYDEAISYFGMPR